MQKQWFVVEANKAHEKGTIKLYIYETSIDKVRARKLAGVSKGILSVWPASAEEVQLIYEKIIEFDRKGVMPIVWAKTLFVASDPDYYRPKHKKWFELKVKLKNPNGNIEDYYFYIYATDIKNCGDYRTLSQLNEKFSNMQTFYIQNGYVDDSDGNMCPREMNAYSENKLKTKIRDKIEEGWNLSMFEAEKFFFTTNKELMELFVKAKRKKAELELRKEVNL